MKEGLACAAFWLIVGMGSLSFVLYRLRHTARCRTLILGQRCIRERGHRPPCRAYLEDAA